MAYELEYVRTDKNGTKYYHDWNCSRCGGQGWASKWMMTGKTCYACGGTGKRMNPKIVKEYTPEYQAKLDAKRDAKLKAIREQQIAGGYEAVMGNWGFNDDGIIYIYTGNTYNIREDLKRGGAKFNWGYSTWESKKLIDGYDHIELKADGLFYFEDNLGRWCMDVEKRDQFYADNKSIIYGKKG